MTDEERKECREVLTHVYNALLAGGYNPINQLIGYMISEDETYIPLRDNARSMIRESDRDELLEEVLTFYFESTR